MDTIPDQQAALRRRRRLHSDEFKADAVARCMQPGMSMAAVAMTHGSNAKLLRRWVRVAELRPLGIALDKPATRDIEASATQPLFIPVSLPPSAVAPPVANIPIELRVAPQRPPSPSRPAPPANARRGCVSYCGEPNTRALSCSVTAVSSRPAFRSQTNLPTRRRPAETARQ